MTFDQRAEAGLMRRREIEATTGCWLWTGCKLPTGHGQLTIKGKVYQAHRVSAYLWLGLDINNRFMGSRRDRSQVNHKCQNASCFNPAHLYVGTQRENVMDIPREKRGGRFQTHCEKGHPMTPDNYTRRTGCLTCFKAYQAKWRAENRAKINARQNAARAAKKALTATGQLVEL